MASTPDTIRVACNQCGEVEARVLGTHVITDDPFPEPQGTALVECPNCRQPLVAQHWYLDEYYTQEEGVVGSWTPFERVWPERDAVIPTDVPQAVGDSLREAQKCLRANAYIACAAMCGRALEGLCRDLNANDKMLAAGLEQLRQTGKIDERLHEWDKALNEKRNIAAHPDLTPISQRDAKYGLTASSSVSRS